MSSHSYLIIKGITYQVFDTAIAFGLMYLLDTAELGHKEVGDDKAISALRGWCPDRAGSGGIYFMNLDDELASIGVSFEVVAKCAQLSLARIAADKSEYIDRDVCARLGKAMGWPISRFQKKTLVELFQIIVEAATRTGGNNF